MARQKHIPLRQYNTGTTSDKDLAHCNWPGCKGNAEHRAPLSRQQLNSYQWFCLEHIRKFNKSWNYYTGMNDIEVEADKRRDTVWRRPTWKIGDKPNDFSAAFDYANPDFYNFNDPLGVYEGVFGENGPSHRESEASAYAPDSVQILTAQHRAAVTIFELDIPFTQTELKSRYKELVKQHHPDAAGSNTVTEEKIREINDAYSVLSSLSPSA